MKLKDANVLKRLDRGDFFLFPLAHLAGEEGEAGAEVFLEDHDVLGMLDVEARKIPDAPDAGRDEAVRETLGLFFRDAEDGKFYPHPLDEVLEFFDRKDLERAGPGPDEFRGRIEDRGDLEPMDRDPLVVEERPALRTGADEENVRIIVAPRGRSRRP